MGPKKKWHMHSQPKRSRDDKQQANSDGGVGGGGSGNGNGNGEASNQQQPSKRARVSAVSLGNVKGHQAVVGTCDVRNDRQATAELVDLLNAFADELYPEGAGQQEQEEEKAAAPPAPEAATPDLDGDGDGGGAKPASVSASSPPSGTPTPTTAAEAPENKPALSVEEMVRQEADALRSGAAKSHRFKSVNTYVRGVVMVCVMDPKVDVLKLVDAVFEGIRSTRKRRCRFLERVTPMQVTAFSELEAFKSAAEPVVLAALPQVAEGVPPIDAGKAAAAAVAPPDKAAAAVAAAATAASAGNSESEASPPPTKEASAGEGVGAGQTAASPPVVETAAAAVAAAVVAASDPDVSDAAGDSSTPTTATTGRTSDGGGGGGGEPSCTDEEATAAGVAEKAEQAVGTTAAAAEGPTAEVAAEVAAAAAAEGPTAEVAAEVAAAAAAAAGGGGGEGPGSGEVVAKKTCDKRWKFRVDVRRRNSGLKRLDLINAVADSVGKGHSVSMSSPEVTIAIEAVKSVVGASVLFNYALNHEYSISRLQDAVCGALLND